MLSVYRVENEGIVIVISIRKGILMTCLMAILKIDLLCRFS
jgi:hypothetical protein